MTTFTKEKPYALFLFKYYKLEKGLGALWPFPSSTCAFPDGWRKLNIISVFKLRIIYDLFIPYDNNNSTIPTF